ncbi:hypothetical protein [Sporosarcina sp. YIM B06819]|uniref:hypothetical protein n=1 Tax=Sporosarcina sp. YIM B06819 TaxID=3081769 RepID=UPI00298C2F04|nr:hypothetical protein [Sporosarcina sp. YIM B06819]
MYTTNQDYVKQRMVDLQQEVSQYKLGHGYQSRKKNVQKPFYEKSFVLFHKCKYKVTFRIGIAK